VAAFEAFLSDLLEEVLIARPEMLKRSGKQVTYEDVVEASSHEELVAQLAEREIGGWFYRSFRDQAAILKERFGIDLDGAEGVDLEGEATVSRTTSPTPTDSLDSSRLSGSSQTQKAPVRTPET
jgi:hypothetical protein